MAILDSQKTSLKFSDSLLKLFGHNKLTNFQAKRIKLAEIAKIGKICCIFKNESKSIGLYLVNSFECFEDLTLLAPPHR